MRISIVVVALLAGTALADPVLITQTYSDQIDQGAWLDDGSGGVEFISGAPGEMYVNGAWTAVTGDWVFRILTDTSNPDLYFDESQERYSFFPHENLGVFATSWITVSNTGLGLDNVRVTNYQYYTELSDYQSGISPAIAPDFSSADIEGTDGAVGDPNVIELDKLDYVKRTTPTATGSPGFASFGFYSDYFGPTHAPLELEDGTTIQGFYSFAAANQVSQPVPEPGSIALFGLVAVGAFVHLRRRNRAL